MANSVLHDFIEIGLLNIAEDDEKFEHLQKTSIEIAKKLPKKKLDLVSHTLVALDPNIPADNPVLVDVEEALTKQWTTFRNRFRDTPRQMLRPIIFEALRSVGQADPSCASIIWLTGGSYLPYAELGKERELCTNFLLQMGEISEKQAIQEWAGSRQYQAPSLQSLEARLSGVAKVEVDSEKLEEHLLAATGPTGGEDANPQWPNQPTTWGPAFATRAAKGIAEIIGDAVNSIPAAINTSVKGLNSDLGKYLSAVNTAIEGTVTEVIEGAVADERRTRLLWWKQTLYSPALHMGYRSLDPVQASFIMAYDLHCQVPPYSPQSVEFLLREAVRMIAPNGQDDSLCELSKMVEQVALGRDAHLVKSLIGTTSNLKGRKPLVGFVQSVLAGGPSGGEELAKEIGVKNDIQISIENFAAWIFRDLQAQRLATMK